MNKIKLLIMTSVVIFGVIFFFQKILALDDVSVVKASSGNQYSEPNPTAPSLLRKMK